MKIAMNVAVVSALLFFHFLAIITIDISFCSGSFDVGEKLQHHKDPSNRLVSSHSVYDSLTADVHEQHHRSLKAEFERPKSAGAKQLPWKNLKYLDLRSNFFEGPIPAPPPNMIVFLVSSNKFTGEIPQLICNSSTIEVLDLSNNSLTGSIPECLGNFSNSLRVLYLQKNSFHGSVPGTFPKGNNLKFLNFSGNGLDGPVPRSLRNCKNLEVLDLGNNNITDTFPRWLGDLPNLRVLILRSNNFHGWIDDLTSNQSLSKLRVFDLSTNYFTGPLPWKNLTYLDLRSNFFEGPIPAPPPNMIVFLVSSNNFTGKIPQLICNSSTIEVLDLSNNSLTGSIPECLGNFSNSLRVLDLRKNSFHGSVPGTFPKGNNLKTLNFNGNGLDGPVPRSLRNCKNLEVLDLGNNNITDTFPRWLGDLPNLQVLIIRSNNFHGPIDDPTSNQSLSKLRVFDLSTNYFTGPLPTKYFQNMKSLMSVDREAEGNKSQYMGETYYEDTVTLIIKKNLVEQMKILKIFTAMDFSKNNFSGGIPQVIGNFYSLRLLNLSHNNLTGSIPSSLGNLMSLESLDFSSNKLGGKIPMQLQNLTFLSTLDLSDNQLVGKIPGGNQFNTFSANSYIRNPGLCGFPLPNECNSKPPQPPPAFEDDKISENGFGWKVVMMGYGFGTVFGMVLGCIVLLTKKPRWLVRIVEGEKHGKMGRPYKKYKARRNVMDGSSFLG